MPYPAIDADTLAAYELDEIKGAGSWHVPVAPPGTFPGQVGVIVDAFDIADGPRYSAKFHTPPHFGGWVGFKNQVTGDQLGYLYDTLPASASTYIIGAPGLFAPNKRCVAFLQGTATEDRDYLVLPVGALPATALTVSLWMQPFLGTAQVWEILHKEYFNESPTDGVLAGTFASPFYGGIQIFGLSTSSGEWGASINIAGTLHTVSITGNGTERFRMRYGQWNHIGATYDGVHFCLYINGQLASSTAQTGNIDYGAGSWVCGASRDAGSPFQMNAAVCRIRWEQVAKPLSYFFDCYTNAGGGGGTPPVIS